MLQALSGHTHHVITGVALLSPSGENDRIFVEDTQVTFAELSPAVIAAYVATGESMDKAGAYGIQAQAAAFVCELHGCYFNVVGLPLHQLSLQLRQLLRL